MLGRLRAVLLGVLGVALVAALWDLYKAFGPEEGVLVGERTLILPRATDLAMPHTWEMVQRLFEPATGLRGSADRVRGGGRRQRLHPRDRGARAGWSASSSGCCWRC